MASLWLSVKCLWEPGHLHGTAEDGKESERVARSRVAPAKDLCWDLSYLLPSSVTCHRQCRGLPGGPGPWHGGQSPEGDSQSQGDQKAGLTPGARTPVGLTLASHIRFLHARLGTAWCPPFCVRMGSHQQAGGDGGHPHHRVGPNIHTNSASPPDPCHHHRVTSTSVATALGATVPRVSLLLCHLTVHPHPFHARWGAGRGATSSLSCGGCARSHRYLASPPVW